MPLSTIPTSSTPEYPGSELIPEMQDAIDHWEGGLRASGGALVPSKSNWYLVDFKWKNGSWRYCSVTDTPGNISMLDHHGLRVPLDQVKVTEASKTFSLMIAGDCNWKAEVARLLPASVVMWRANLKGGHLLMLDAWYALNHSINKTVKYPMMATDLEKDKCEMIMKPFLNAGLSASGVVKTMLRPVVWGPLQYQGLIICHLWTTQGVDHILAILPHATRSTFTGQLLCTSMEETQQEIGVSQSLLAYSYSNYGSLATRSWITSTWHFLSESNITMKDPFDQPHLTCENDCFLMESFFAHGYQGTELHHLNSCRMHLHALLLSDLCTADGTRLTDNATEVHTDPHWSSPFSWPRSHRPEFKIRALWRTALAKTFVRPFDEQVLNQPLCPFTPAASATWLWKFSPSEQRLLVPNGNLWDFCHVSAGHRRSVNRLYKLGETSQTLPADSRAATVSLQGP